MTKTKKYSNLLSTFILNFEAKFKNASDGLTTLSIIDKERHHYQSAIHGFSNETYVFIVQFHFNIIHEKIWIQSNKTDIDLGEELIEMGVPKSDIVIGFLSEFERKHSGYGVERELV